MCHKTPEISANDTLPGGVVKSIELLFNVRSNVFFSIIIVHCLGSAVDRFFLKVFSHVHVFDLSLSHCKREEIFSFNLVYINSLTALTATLKIAER